MRESFLEVSPKRVLDTPGVYLLGLPFDGTACFRKGARFGPAQLRMASHGLESYSPYQRADLKGLEGRCFDGGDLPVRAQREEGLVESWRSFEELLAGRHLERDAIKLVGLGGEHSISYPFVKKALEDYEELVILHLDAHADLRDGHEGYHYSHASIIFRLLELLGPKHGLIQYGIRSGTREEYDLMAQRGSLVGPREDFLQRVSSLPASTPLYLTLDLDYFDPSIMPGTGTPEPGGEDFRSFLDLIGLLGEKNFVGADVVELAPYIDPTGNSSVLAAKVVREIILAMA